MAEDPRLFTYPGLDPTKVTIESYARHADHYGDSHDNPGFWRAELDRFFDQLKPGRHILEVGCGAGRDAAEFLRHDYRYMGSDLCREVVAGCQRRFPQQAGRFVQQDMRRMAVASASMDGLWASACLAHVPREETLDVLFEFNRVLHTGGALFVSLKRGEGQGFIETYKRYGVLRRWFTLWDEQSFGQLLVEAGFFIKWRDVRPYPKRLDWLSFIATKQG